MNKREPLDNASVLLAGDKGLQSSGMNVIAGRSCFGAHTYEPQQALGDPRTLRGCWLTDTVGPCRPNWWDSARKRIRDLTQYCCAQRDRFCG